MTTLIVTTSLRGASTTLVAVRASFDGGIFVDPDNDILDVHVFNVPDEPPQVTLSVIALDTGAFSTSGTFVADGNGGLIAGSAPAEFGPPTTTISGADVTISISVTMPELRDATSDSVAALDPPPARAPLGPQHPVTSWSPPPNVDGISVVSTPCLSAKTLQFVKKSVSPDGEIVVLDRAAADPPVRLVVYWPASVSREADAPPTSFLYFLKPTAFQNSRPVAGEPEKPIFVNPGDRKDPDTGSTYPNGFDYNFFGLWRVFHYSDDLDKNGQSLSDPILGDAAWKGIPYQVEASGKPVVVVLAMNEVAVNPCDELKALSSAFDLRRLLLDVQAFMFRRAGNPNPPGIGRLAMASFSSGHNTLACLLASPGNPADPFITDTLQEIYLFDPNADRAGPFAGTVQAIADWLKTGPSTQKIARVYSQLTPKDDQGNDLLAPILAQLQIVAPPQSPFDVNSPVNANVSVTCLPLGMWNQLSNSKFTKSVDAHQVIPAVMLTDALRRSRF